MQDAITDAGRQVLIASSYLKTSNEKCKLEDKANSATDRRAESIGRRSAVNVELHRTLAPALRGEPSCWHDGNFAGHAHTDDLKCSTNEK